MLLRSPVIFLSISMTLAPSWSPPPIAEVAIIEDTDVEVAYVTEDAGVTLTFTEVDDATEKVVEGDDVIEAADVTGVSFTEVTEDVERVEDTDVRETADVIYIYKVVKKKIKINSIFNQI
ncbi:hypothetical protein DPMN_075986 [Dreissena polymorpha]|uniref:Uncharacterized protein n=1 Tax=Dreissena polymorpha TaxID=45954 RepID=A0A9D3YLF8_DREPO|nr:hypothetical protein DPMN_075986 [Dreissena polymorpha]